jgi:hypothetical protein
MTSPKPEVTAAEESTISLLAPYVTVLVVLAVTAIELLRGRHIGTVSWFMALALAVLVLGRELLRFLGGTGTHGVDTHDPGGEESTLRPGAKAALHGGEMS